MTAETDLTILEGDCLEQMRALPDACVQCCVTSPPYFGLRDYQVEGQIGLEKSHAEYVAKMVGVFREVRRLLKPDGTLWLNLGDSYAGSGCGGNPADSKFQKQASNRGSEQFVKSKRMERGSGRWGGGNVPTPIGLKPKDLIGIPWRVAFALQADGWWWRSCIPWLKRNTMPESVTDRPASAVEYLLLLTKSQDCFYDVEAVRVAASESYMNDGRWNTGPTDANVKDGYELAGTRNPKATHEVFNGERRTTRNRRNSDWFFESWQGLYEENDEPLALVVNTHPCRLAHFSTFPKKLVQPCVLAGSRPGDLVLDPFAGSGTTGQVALELGRRALLIELNPAYVDLIRQRCAVTPGLHL